MRRFHYYLYDNYDPAKIRNHTDDPRRILTPELDGVLSAIIAAPPGGCRYISLSGSFTPAFIDRLI